MPNSSTAAADAHAEVRIFALPQAPPPPGCLAHLRPQQVAGADRRPATYPPAHSTQLCTKRRAEAVPDRPHDPQARQTPLPNWPAGLQQRETNTDGLSSHKTQNQAARVQAENTTTVAYDTGGRLTYCAHCAISGQITPCSHESRFRVTHAT